LFLFIISISFEFSKNFGVGEDVVLYFCFWDSVLHNQLKIRKLGGPAHQHLPMATCCVKERRARCCSTSLHRATPPCRTPPLSRREGTTHPFPRSPSCLRSRSRSLSFLLLRAVEASPCPFPPPKPSCQ
jgi:hypothetical protein